MDYSQYDTDYTGLAAVTWELFSGETPGPDVPHFEAIIRQSGTPALDVGCAHGRLLLPFLAAGLEVEGVEPSADLREICRRRAAALGLTPHLYDQTLQTLDLQTLNTGRRYRTVIIPCGTLQLVADYAEARDTLRRLHDHLEPGGTLALTLYPVRPGDAPPAETGNQHPPEAAWHHRMTAPLPSATDGTEIAKHAFYTNFNYVEQTLSAIVRYRRRRGETILEEQLCHAPERWYGKNEMVLMLEAAGFSVVRIVGNYTDEPANDTHYVWTFLAAR